MSNSIFDENDNQNSISTDDGQDFSSPLPEFTGDSFTADESPLFKSSTATPSNLDELLSQQRPAAPVELTGAETEAQPAAGGPSYKVSPAQADQPGYPASMLPTDAPAAETPDTPSAEQSSGWQTTWAVVREVGETVILTLVIFLLIQTVVRNFRVVGTSMVNNLHDGQYLIIDKLTYNPWLNQYLGIGGLERGDVVVFVPPRRPDEDYVKRIIALPGEKVQVIKGVVYVNDAPMPEPFSPNPGSYTMPQPLIVPQNTVFVLGDNRNNSNDSHNWGPLPIDNIVGRAWLSYWPPALWGVIPRDAPSEETTLKHWFSQVIPNANAKSE